ncbi:MAG TPA: rhomboid family intramembrane serine protease [Iamia sp.]|nr:rhomboid family intramembrane serine protease [Iamia sp.]
MSRYSFSMPSHPGRKGWFRVGEIEITTTAIMVALGVVSMFVYAVDKVFLANFMFFGDAVRDGEVWRLVTWPLVNPPDRIWVIITLAFFWFVGHRIEDEIGRVRFLVLMGVTAILAGVVVTALPLTAETGVGYGLSILAFALLVVIAVRNPQEPWFFGIPIWILVAVFAAVDVLGLVGDRLWGILLLEAASVVIMTIGAAVCGLVDVLPFVPRVGAASPSGGRRVKGRRAKGARGTVTQGPWSSPSGFSPAGPSRLEQAELDVLLDKIGQSGIDSLSKDERRRLDELSRRMRDT